jgi:hypothetical protein
MATSRENFDALEASIDYYDSKAWKYDDNPRCDVCNKPSLSGSVVCDWCSGAEQREMFWERQNNGVQDDERRIG